MIGIVVSRADEASVRIGEHLLDRRDWAESTDRSTPAAVGGGTVSRTDGFELRTFDDLHIELEGAAATFDAIDALVFASRHAGETGPLLTAHFTGNAGAADFGGEPGTLARAWPAGLAQVYSALDRYAPDGYTVGIECTHHGPTDLPVPSMFVEIGSGPAEWRDDDAASAAARAILQLTTEGGPDRTVVGFGGGHYAPRFERIIDDTRWAVGHVLADWALDDSKSDLDELVPQAFDRSDATRAVVEGRRPVLAETIEALGYRVVSETWVRETDAVPLALVDRLETRLRPVDEGLRFGERRPADDGRTTLYEPDESLLADLHGIDAERTRRAVAANAVAYETEENGHRVTGRIALPAAVGRKPLIEAMIGILRSRFDDVDRCGDSLVVRETAFAPDRARDLDVPEGPAFGRLADGQPVEVGAETVTPEMVHIERERRYRL